MSSLGSVTHWIHLVAAGDHEAVGPLWQRYFPLLVNRARAALRGKPCAHADAEDVALSALDSFCRNAQQGRFPRLEDRHDLWRLLLVLTARKAAHLVRDELRQKRGGRRVVNQTDLIGADGDGESELADTIGREPTPAFAAQVAEEYQRLLDRLGDADLRAIAVWQMEGYQVEEIAAKLGRSPRTVARKLAVIRDRWNAEEPAL
jgi:DNA-directed RNA polymerase specialized sigma24 family protein